MADNPTFQIPKDVIEPIIQAQISAAVLAALQPTGRALEQAVNAVLTMKVDGEGKPERYSDVRSKMWIMWIDWVMGDAIQKAARSAIEQHMAEQQKAIRAAIARQLTARNSPLAKQLIDGMLSAVVSESTLKYRINITSEKADMDTAQKQAAAKRYLHSKTLFAQLGNRYVFAPANHVQKLPPPLPTAFDQWRAARVLAREQAAKPPVAVLKRAAKS